MEHFGGKSGQMIQDQFNEAAEWADLASNGPVNPGCELLRETRWLLRIIPDKFRSSGDVGMA